MLDDSSLFDIPVKVTLYRISWYHKLFNNLNRVKNRLDKKAMARVKNKSWETGRSINLNNRKRGGLELNVLNYFPSIRKNFQQIAWN